MEEKKIGCLGGLFKLFGLVPKKEKETLMPYALRDDFLSKAEFSFYKVLANVIGDQYHICAKVGLNDLFYVTDTKGEHPLTYLNKINRKHVDFIICDKKTMYPIMGIELDDKSHNRSDRIARDAFVDRLFKVSKLPLVHFKVKHSYVPSEITEQVQEVFTKIEKNNTTETSSTKNNKVICPKCNIEMQLRRASKGVYAGNQFYSCVNYPKCREIVNID